MWYISIILIEIDVGSHLCNMYNAFFIDTYETLYLQNPQIIELLQQLIETSHMFISSNKMHQWGFETVFFQIFNRKVRISMGPSSTTKSEVLTGPPLTTWGSCPLSPSTFHVIFFISDFSWLADKLTSFNSFICIIKVNFIQIMSKKLCASQRQAKNGRKVLCTVFEANNFLNSTLVRVEYWTSSLG